MDLKYLLVAACTALSLAPAQRHDRVGVPFDATVVYIADGDTLELIPAGERQRIRVRLEGVDAPELGEVFSREAQAFSRTLLFDQPVRVAGRDVDRYGRLVARVVAGGRDASVELLRAGLACHRFAPDAALAAAESAARAGGKGFWAAAAKKPQCVERSGAAARPRTAAPPPTSLPAARLADTITRYRGNVNSRLYHASHCPSYNCRNCTRVFASEAAAKAEGFAPANDCLRPQH